MTHIWSKDLFPNSNPKAIDIIFHFLSEKEWILITSIPAALITFKCFLPFAIHHLCHQQKNPFYVPKIQLPYQATIAEKRAYCFAVCSGVCLAKYMVKVSCFCNWKLPLERLFYAVRLMLIKWNRNDSLRCRTWWVQIQLNIFYRDNFFLAEIFFLCILLCCEKQWPLVTS